MTQTFKWRYKQLFINGKRVLEHRYIMEQKLGRKLLRSEIVHHRDGNQLNNKPENLELGNQSQHAKEHAIKRGRFIDLVCDLCFKKFKRAYHNRPNNKKQKHIFCSKTCCGKYMVEVKRQRTASEAQ